MRLFLVSAISLISATLIASGQSLSVFGLDTSQFPVMKAKFYAFDAAGQQARPSATEIAVSEDGVPRTVLSVTCPPLQAIPPISLAMSLDISSSMSHIDSGDTPVELSKTTIRELMARIVHPLSEYALQTCNDRALIAQDFTASANTIVAALAPVQAWGGNDFAEQLLNPLTGLLAVAKTGRHRRVAILYTDAWWPPLSADLLQQCKDTCSRYGIEFYAVIYTRPDAEPNGIKTSLKDLAAATGGIVIDGVTSKEAAGEIALQLQQQMQGSMPCDIVWQSAVPCVASHRRVLFNWNGQTAQAAYMLQANTVSQLSFDPPSVFFQYKPAGQKSDTTVTVTAVNAPFTVTGIASLDPAYDINPKTFTLAPGQSRTLTVSYTPPGNGYTWTRFDIQNNVCTQSYYASGGILGAPPVIATLHLDHPNGGEIFVAGIDTVIRWSGIPPHDTVRLEYSIDKGKNWQLIAEKATGGRYVWHVPRTPSTQCLVRVMQLSRSLGNWARRAGGAYTDQGSDIAVDFAGNIYITGYVQDTADFNGIPLKSVGGSDLFVARYYPDGNLAWVKPVKGTGAERVSHIAVDRTGNIYVAGNAGGVVDFGGYALTVAGSTFLAKYHSDGSVEWAKRVDGSVTALTVDQADRVNVVYDLLPDIYVARFSQYGNLEVTKKLATAETATGSAGSSNGIAINAVGYLYLTGNFKGSFSFGDDLLVTSSTTNGFLAKYRADLTVEWVRMLDGSIAGVAAGDTGYVCVIGPGLMAKYNVFGDTVWLKRSGGHTPYGGNGIATGDAGSIYVAGSGIAKYYPDGNFEWKKTAGGSGTDIAVDGAKNIYTIGDFQSTAGFESNTLVSAGVTDLFVWKLGNDTLQRDISDAVFSIVMPSALSQNVDMGRTIVGAVKDSVVETFVRNVGTYRFNVSEIQIVGADASHFSMIGGIPPFDLPAGDSFAVEFRFRPSSAGRKSAQLLVITQSDTLRQTISGEGVAALLAVVASVIDFGQVEVGMQRDTLRAVTVRNLGSVPLPVTATRHGGPNDRDYSTLAGEGPFTLQPGDTALLNLRFAPSLPGRTSGTLLFEYDDIGSPAVVQLFGEGIVQAAQIQAVGLTFAPSACAVDDVDTVDVFNIGGEDLDISSAAITGTNAGEFVLARPFVPVTIPPGGRTGIAVRFTPQATGDRSAVLELRSNSTTDSILVLALSGRAERADFSVSPSIIDLGLLCPDEGRDIMIVLRNRGTMPNTIRAEEGGLTLAEGSALLDVNAADTMTIRFTGRSAEGRVDEVLVLTDTVCGLQRTVRLTADIEMPEANASDITLKGVAGGAAVEDTVLVQNRGGREVTIATQPDISPFEFVDTAFPLTIPSQGSIGLRVRYRAVDTIRQSVQLRLEGRPCDIVIMSRIEGTGTDAQDATAGVAASDIAAYPGDEVSLPVILDEGVNIAQSGATSLTVTLRFNATLLDPIGNTPRGTVVGNERVVPLELPVTPQSSNVLTTLRFRAMLGNDTATALTLENPGAVGGTVAVRAESGRFRLLGVCMDGGVRLLNPAGMVKIVAVRPNPVTDEAEVEITTMEAGRTRVVVMDMLGREAMTVYDGELPSGHHILPLTTRQLTTGSYYMLLTTPTVRYVHRVDIVN